MKVEGLQYVRGFVTAAEEAALLTAIDSERWRHDLKRRVQHYGYRYDYKARTVDEWMRLGSLPAWVTRIAKRLVSDGYFATEPDQLIVNEYQPGQGISPHVDCEPCFGPVICSISLGSQCVMEFAEVVGAGRVSMLLERCSAVVLSGPARSVWKHSIPARKSDRVDERVIPRGRRVSLTFRTVVVRKTS